MCNYTQSSDWFGLVLWHISGATTPVQSGPGSNDKEGLLCIRQNSIYRTLIGEGVTTLGCILLPQLTGVDDFGIRQPTKEIVLMYVYIRQKRNFDLKKDIMNLFADISKS